jgi:hypothetical protein
MTSSSGGAGVGLRLVRWLQGALGRDGEFSLPRRRLRREAAASSWLAPVPERIRLREERGGCGTLAGKMPISEPATLATDYLLATVALWLAARLAARSSRSRSWAQTLWAVAFATGAAAAAAGGTVHGLRAAIGSFVSAFLWQCALFGSALAGMLLVAGAAIAVLSGPARRVALGVAGAGLLAELAVISRASLTRDAVGAGAANVALLLALAVWRARSEASLLRWLLLGLALVGAALGVQAARLSPHPLFNHNDLCHVVLTAALWPIYRAGLLLR